MARTLSVVAQEPLLRSVFIATAMWTILAPSVLAEETVRVTTTQPLVIQNPFAQPGAERTAVNAPSTIVVTPEAAVTPSATPTVAPIRRLPGSTISVLPPVGPRTYQNPFAEPLAPPPAADSAILPGPISRWRRSVAAPADDSPVTSAIRAAEAQSTVDTFDPIQRANLPWDQLPPAEKLRDFRANSQTFSVQAGARASQPPDPIQFEPTDLTQPVSMVPDEDGRPATTADIPALVAQRAFDPFEASTTANSRKSEPASFVPPETAGTGLPLSAVPIEPATPPVLISDDGEVSDDGEAPAGALARAEQLAKAAQSAEELTAVAIECKRGLEISPPGDEGLALRRLAAWALNRRGELAVEAGDEHSALEDFQSAIELDAECWLALHNRGVTLAQQNQFDAALEDFNRVVALNPGLAIVYRNRGELLAALDRMDEAVRDYDRAIEQMAGDASLHFARGYALHRLGDYQRALADLNQSIQLAPDQPDAYTQRGNIHAERGEFLAAASDLEKSIALDADRPEAYRSLAWLRATCPDARYRDAEQAIAAAQRAVELAPANDCLMLEALAAARANAGQFEEAIRIQQQALATASPDIRRLLEDRLELYRQGEAFRSGPRAAVRTASHEGSPAPRPSPQLRRPRR